MSYVFSKYNICTSDKRVYLVFNTLSQSLIEVTKEEYDYFKKGDSFYIDSLKKDEIDYLLEYGFIIDESIDELALIKDYYWFNKYNDSTLNISILTTLNCNFRCPYCFETRRNVDLKDDVKKAILSFIKDHLKGKELLHVDWYGGEPLMKKNTIIEMSKDLKEICKKEKVKYFSTITSNGFLLTESIAKELAEAGVGGAQITIDGSEKYHNTTRVLANNNPTYKVILKHIKGASKYMKIFVRSNVSEETMDGMDDLFEDLKGIDNIKLSIKGIVPASYKKYDKKLLSAKDFSNKVIDNYLKADSLDIDTALDTFLSNEFHRFCIVDSDSQFIISPEGNIVKCGESYTEDDKGIIGRYNKETKKLEIDENKKIFWDKDPFSYKECIKCKSLPLCYGGCQMKRKVKNESPCSPELKYNINRLILWLYYKNMNEE